MITLLAKDNQKLPILVSKGFEGLVYWNEYKTKSWNKNTTNECRYLTEANFLRVNRLFVLTDPNEDASVKRFSGKKYYLPKGNIKNCNVIVNGKNFCGTIPGQKKLKKNSGGGAAYYKILLAIMFGQQRKCFISNLQQRLERRNICRRQVMQIAIIIGVY